jgi:NitT/TauT family transport system permease protein
MVIKVKKYINAGIAIICAMILLQILTELNVNFIINFKNLPSPSEVFLSLGQTLNLEFAKHIIYSLLRVLGGFSLAILIALPLAALISEFSFFKNYIYPLLEIIRPIPLVAWVPLAIIMFASLEKSILFITTIGPLFPILINTLHGIRDVPNEYIQAARSLGSNPLQIQTKIILPYALPFIFTGLKIGIGISWIGVIAAEMISGQFGIGYFTWVNYHLINYNNIIIGIMTIGILGYITTKLISLIGNKIMPWYAYEKR